MDSKNLSKIGVIVVLLAVVGYLAFVFITPSGNNITGNTVYVNYYGVSNYPLNLNTACGSNSYCKKGVQTLVTMSKSDVAGLSNSGTVITVAGKIVDAINLGSTITSLYKEGLNAVPGMAIPVPTSGLDIVTQASGAVISEFKKNTNCLSSIGSRLSPDSKGRYQFALVSYMSYKVCRYYDDWMYAYIRHDYYTTGGKYLCTYEGTKLFSMEMGTGKISKSTAGC